MNVTLYQFTFFTSDLLRSSVNHDAVVGDGCFYTYSLLARLMIGRYCSLSVEIIMLNQCSGAPNDGIFPNASEVSEMCHSVRGKPV